MFAKLDRRSACRPPKKMNRQVQTPGFLCVAGQSRGCHDLRAGQAFVLALPGWRRNGRTDACHQSPPSILRFVPARIHFFATDSATAGEDWIQESSERFGAETPGCCFPGSSAFSSSAAQNFFVRLENVLK